MEQPAVYSIAELVQIGPLSRSKIYLEIGAGRLRAVKAGRRTLILRTDYEQYLANLPSALLPSPSQTEAPPTSVRAGTESFHGE